MPAQAPLPTIRALRDAYSDGVRVDAEPNADLRSGSTLDLFGGTSAVIAAREAYRDRGLFRRAYFDTATGIELADFALRRYGVQAIEASRGVGVARIARAVGGATDIPAGTRILLERDARLTLYEVPENVFTVATEVTIPVRASEDGPSFAADNVREGLRFVDVLPAVWTVESLTCSAGTLQEQPDALRARARSEAAARRNGLTAAIVRAAQAEGAGFVATFASNYRGPDEDSRVSAVYVGAPGLALDMDLVRRVMVRLDSVRVGGGDLMVLPMVGEALTLVGTARLSDSPARLDVAAISRATTEALLEEFGRRESPYLYRLASLEGAVVAASSGQVTQLAFSEPETEPSISPLSFPASLTRWTLAARDIRIQFVGP